MSDPHTALQDPFVPQQTYGLIELFRFQNTYTRQRYWATGLLAFAANFIVNFALGLIAAIVPLAFLGVFVVAFLSAWIFFAISIKRLRDAGLSLWWVLLGLLPVVNFIAIIVFGCVKTAKQKNTNSAKAVIITYVGIVGVCAAAIFGMIAIGSKVAKDLDAAYAPAIEQPYAENGAGTPIDAAPAVEPTAEQPVENAPATEPVSE